MMANYWYRESKDDSDKVEITPMDKAIDEMSEALESWERKAIEYHNAKTSFEAWEAGTKKTFMHAGMSGVAAEAEMKCKGQFQPGHGSAWEAHANKVNELMVQEKAAAKKIRVAEMRWETERSKNATLRNVK